MEKRILLLIGNVIIFPILLFVAYDISQKQYDEWLGSFLGLIIVSLAIQIITILYIKRKEVLISLVFIIGASLFHFSHVFLLYIGYDFGNNIRLVPFVRHGVENTMKSMMVSWLFIYGVYIGIIFAIYIKKIYKTKRIKIKYSELDQTSYGMFLVVVSLPVFVYRVILYFVHLSEEGYAYAVSMDNNMYLTMLSNMMLPGFILWMTSRSVKKNQAIGIYAFGITLRIVAMLTGQRAYNLMYVLILTIVFIYVFYRHKLKKRHGILVVIVGYLGCIGLSIIRIVRMQGINISAILRTLVEFEENPIFSMLSEFGITGNIVSYTYKMSEVALGGKQLLSSIASVIPGISHMLPNVDWSQLNVTEALDAWNWGGSFVADFYFDFHYAGFCMAIVWGFFFQKVSGKYIKALIEKNMYVVAWLSPIICEMFFCMRSTTYKIPRLFIYYFVLYVGLAIIYLIIRNLYAMKNEEKR